MSLWKAGWFWMTLLVLASMLVACDSGEQKAGAPVAAAVKVGQPAPDFTLPDIHGKNYRLSELRGKVVLVNFWATWCPPCRAEMPSMEALDQLFGDDQLVILAINVEEDARDIIQEFLQENPHSFPILLDDAGEVHQRFGVFRFPETFIVRSDGQIAEHVIGAIDWTSPKIVNLIRFLVKG
jgi:peroxiredoxin